MKQLIEKGTKIRESKTGNILTVYDSQSTFNGGIFAIFCKPYGKFYYDSILNIIPFKGFNTYPKVWLNFRGWGTILS